MQTVNTSLYHICSQVAHSLWRGSDIPMVTVCIYYATTSTCRMHIVQLQNIAIESTASYIFCDLFTHFQYRTTDFIPYLKSTCLIATARPGGDGGLEGKYISMARNIRAAQANSEMQSRLFRISKSAFSYSLIVKY